ncbi:MAG: type II toxin-antitoxin system RelE/ParE family toxin [Succinivibrio sp.]|nr:type II toxin-antitoxin system RelE/ParE family toxin [Succinivibrio sp.]
MTFDVQISKQAERDLRDIYEYFAFDLQSPQEAERQVRRLEEGIHQLSDMPQKFRKYAHEPWRSRGLRVFHVDKYLIFYIPDMEFNKVTVIRVLYSGRNIEHVLNQYTH